MDYEFENINFKNERQLKNLQFVLKNIITNEIEQNPLKHIVIDISNLDEFEIQKVCELLKDFKKIIVNKKYKKICVM